ncbi:MAG: NUDIX hydrolase [Candidatus Thorarchaeota archaeon]
MVSFDDIKSALVNYHSKKLPDDGSKRGAVLIPIFEENNELIIIFTKRTEDLPTHKGQISFPGGKIEEKDNSLLACAYREVYEEIGIPAEKVEYLGELNQRKTNSSNILLSSFVGKINHPFLIKINEAEVHEIINVPLNYFFDNTLWSSQNVILDNEKTTIWFIEYKSHIIWGSTAQITRELIDILIENKPK